MLDVMHSFAHPVIHSFIHSCSARAVETLAIMTFLPPTRPYNATSTPEEATIALEPVAGSDGQAWQEGIRAYDGAFS